jgi:hypothetical protein
MNHRQRGRQEQIIDRKKDNKESQRERKTRKNHKQKERQKQIIDRKKDKKES